MADFLLKDTLEAKQFDIKDEVAAKEYLMREQVQSVQINTNVPPPDVP